MQRVLGTPSSALLRLSAIDPDWTYPYVFFVHQCYVAKSAMYQYVYPCNFFIVWCIITSVFSLLLLLCFYFVYVSCYVWKMRSKFDSRNNNTGRPRTSHPAALSQETVGIILDTMAYARSFLLDQMTWFSVKCCTAQILCTYLLWSVPRHTMCLWRRIHVFDLIWFDLGIY